MFGNINKDDDNDKVYPTDYDNLKKDTIEGELDDEQKKLLETFIKGIEDYTRHREENNINGWYFHTTPDDFYYLHDTGFYVEHLPTSRTIRLGSEYEGLMNSLRFLQAITEPLKELPLKDSCYNCAYYLPDEYFEQQTTLSRLSHGIRCFRLHPDSNYNDYKLPPYLTEGTGISKERMLLEEKHLLRQACEFHHSLENPRQHYDYTQYDKLPTEWHRLNSINDWSLFVCKSIKDYRRGPSADDIYLARHMKNNQTIYMGLNTKGYENSMNLFHAIAGNKNIDKLGSCRTCQHYPEKTKEDICLKNQFMKEQCKHYTKKMIND